MSFESRILLDGGAYRSSSYHVTANAACFAAGPYRVPNAHVHAIAVRTNNPPCGAMRGFGVVQSCFAHEAQMDLLADACGIDPVELRLRNALAPGDELLTGQRIEGDAAGRRGHPHVRGAAAARRPRPTTCSRARAAPAAPPTRPTSAAASASRSASRTSCTPRATWTVRSRAAASTRGVVTITCAAAEVGQGFVTLVQQIAPHGARRRRRDRRAGRHERSARPAPRRRAARR